RSFRVAPRSFLGARDDYSSAAPPAHAPDAATDALPPPWQRLLALSGVAFVPFFVVHDNQSKSRISAFAMLLAGFIFLYFMATIRSVLKVRRLRCAAPHNSPASPSQVP